MQDEDLFGTRLDFAKGTDGRGNEREEDEEEEAPEQSCAALSSAALGNAAGPGTRACSRARSDTSKSAGAGQKCPGSCTRGGGTRGKSNEKGKASSL